MDIGAPAMKLFSNWFERHRHPASRVLHGIGIPMTLAAVGLAVYQLWLWRWDLWLRPAALLAVGYVLQWIGHLIEGSPMGELMLIKRLLVGRSDAGASSDRRP
jgi:hypothetical protein